MVAALRPTTSPKTWKSGRQPMTMSSDGTSWIVGGRAQRVEVDVAVGELGALGPAGGAGGVEDDRGVVVGALVRLGDRVAALEAALDRAHRAALDDRGAAVGRALGGLGHEVGPHEGDLGARVGEEVVDLAGLEQRVHRHDDAAGQEDAPVDDGERRHVGEDDRHPVARLDPVGAQGSCDPGGHAVQLGVGDALAVDPQCVLLGVLRGGGGEVRREVGHLRLLWVRRRWRLPHPDPGCRGRARE